MTSSIYMHVLTKTKPSLTSTKNQAKPIFAKPNFDIKQSQAKFQLKPSQADFVKPGHKQYQMPSNICHNEYQYC